MNLNDEFISEMIISPLTSTTFHQVLNIQQKLNQENALKEILEKNKQDILFEIEANCFLFFSKKIEMAERYDYIQTPKETRTPCTYELAKEPKKLLPETYDPLFKYCLMFRNSNELLLNLVSCCNKPEQKKELASLFGSFFFENIFSTNYIEDSLLTLIYLNLEKDINSLKSSDIISPSIEQINKDEVPFSFLLLNQLKYKEDIKAYLSLILNNIILEIENKEDNYLCLDTEKIFKNSVEKNDYIKFCKEKDQNKKEQPKGTNPFLSSYEILSESLDSKSNHEMEGFVDQRRNSNSIRGSTFISESSILANFSVSEIEEESGNEMPPSGDTIFESSKCEMINRVTIETNEDTKKFIFKQLSQITEDATIFMNGHFCEKVKEMEPFSRKIITIYKNHFYKIKHYIRKLLMRLIEYQEVIPYSMKVICKMISMLIKKKFPTTSSIDLNTYLSKFIFDQLIFPFFMDFDKNGILTTIVSQYTRSTIRLIIKVTRQLMLGQLFISKIDPNFTLFNSFIIDISHYAFSFFNALTNVHLPQKIEKLFNTKDSPDRNINYSFLDENPSENVEHQSMCLNWYDILLLYDIVSNNPEVFPKKKYELFHKHLSKISFKINAIRNKLADDVTNKTKTFILLTKMNMTKALEEKLKFKTEEKITFQCEQSGNNSNFYLPRIKYCFRKILGTLQSLAKEDLNVNGALSTEQFVQTLYKMLEVEEHAISWFESSIPLAWYGLYLKTNLTLIPPEYKDNNYTLLYEEMIHETDQFFKKCDTKVMNHLLLKNKNSIKKNTVIHANLFKLKQIEKYIALQDFVEKDETPICICYMPMVGKEGKYLEISKPENCSHTKFGYLDKMMFEKKRSSQYHFNSVKTLVSKFPNVQREQELTDINLDLFKFEEKLKIDEAIHQYFKILYDYFKADESFSRYGVELDSIFHELTSYIMTKLYRKLVSDFPDTSDIAFFQKCISLDWVQPHHVVHDKKIIDEELWKASLKYLDQMDREKSPLNKINAFSQASKIIQNSITFCSGKNELGVDDSLNVFIYIVLKGKPKRIMSNVKYISMYLNKDLQKKDKGLLLAQLNMVVNIIQKMSHDDTGITADEWDR